MSKLSLLVLVVGLLGMALSAHGLSARVVRRNAKSQYWFAASTGAKSLSDLRSLMRLNRLVSAGGLAISTAVVVAALVVR